MFERAKIACRKEKKDTPDFMEDFLAEEESHLLRCEQNQTYYRSGRRSRGAQRRAKPG